MNKRVWLLKYRVILCFVVGWLAGAIQLTPLRLFTFTSEGFRWSEWTGFGKDETVVVSEERDSKGNTKTVTTTTPQSGKTLWDWLGVLGAPLSLAILGFWFQQLQQNQALEQAERERVRAEQQAQVERDIAEITQREEALQTYFDRLSELLFDKNLLKMAAIGFLSFEEQEIFDTAVDIIRARTLSTLRRFEGDKERKTGVIRFLVEAEVISKLKLRLNYAELQGVNLSGAKLSGADLGNAKLSGAELSGAELSGAKLGSADLSNANLIGVNFSNASLAFANLQSATLSLSDLRDADLLHAKLGGANLLGVKLSRANLENAKLGGANLLMVNLSGANLSGANFKSTVLTRANLSQVQNWTEEQLSEALLCETVLPEGCDLKSNRDCKKWVATRSSPQT